MHDHHNRPRHGGCKPWRGQNTIAGIGVSLEGNEAPARRQPRREGHAYGHRNHQGSGEAPIGSAAERVLEKELGLRDQAVRGKIGKSSHALAIGSSTEYHASDLMEKAQ